MCPPWILCPRDPNRPELPWPLRLLLFPRAISCSTCIASPMAIPGLLLSSHLHRRRGTASDIGAWRKSSLSVQYVPGQHSHTQRPGRQRSPTFKEGVILQAGMEV